MFYGVRYEGDEEVEKRNMQIYSGGENGAALKNGMGYVYGMCFLHVMSLGARV